MVGVEEGREFRFRGDLYSQESTFPLVLELLWVPSWWWSDGVLGGGLTEIISDHFSSVRSSLE